MEKRNTLLLTVIAIATLLVAVVGATFAYFATTQEISANIPVNVATASSSASFTATTDGDINIMVDAFEMQQGDANDNTTIEGLTDNATLTVQLGAANDGEESICSYDIIYTWTSNKYALDASGNVTTDGATQYYIPTADLPTDGKEFTISATAVASNETDTQTKSTVTPVAETNFDKFTIAGQTDAGKDYFILVDDANIVSTAADASRAVKVVWTFEAKFYNLTKDQTKLMNKTFSGTISVDPNSVKC